MDKVEIESKEEPAESSEEACAREVERLKGLGYHPYNFYFTEQDTQSILRDLADCGVEALMGPAQVSAPNLSSQVLYFPVWVHALIATGKDDKPHKVRLLADDLNKAKSASDFQYVEDPSEIAEGEVAVDAARSSLDEDELRRVAQSLELQQHRIAEAAMLTSDPLFVEAVKDERYEGTEGRPGDSVEDSGGDDEGGADCRDGSG